MILGRILKFWAGFCVTVFIEPSLRGHSFHWKNVLKLKSRGAQMSAWINLTVRFAFGICVKLKSDRDTPS